MSNRLYLYLLLPLLCTFTLFTVDEPDYDSCTSIMIGKAASADGSVMTAHTCDANYRTWIDFVPAKVHKNGDMADIFKGSMHNFFSGDKRVIEKMGTIPQVEKTYRYRHTAYPVMNEYQLGMGETTFGGRKELV